MQKYPNVFILDVRTPEEFEKGHLKGAYNISHDQLEARINEINVYKDAKVLVYCGSGIRSRKATITLYKNDFTDIFHMYEGYGAYIKEFPNE